MEKSESKKIPKVIIWIVAVPLVFLVSIILLLVSSSVYKNYYTHTIKTAAVTKADDHYLITIKRTRTIGGHFELNPVRWFFPHIIETSKTLKVPRIEGKINGDQIHTRSEAYDFWSSIYDGSIEFRNKKEMKIGFSCDAKLDCHYWNGEYELVFNE